jgi:hypothetical protein
VVADDANTIFVDAWGAGVTNLRLGWTGVGTELGYRAKS